jgi:hypothetical protein
LPLPNLCCAMKLSTCCIRSTPNERCCNLMRGSLWRGAAMTRRITGP